MRLPARRCCGHADPQSPSGCAHNRAPRRADRLEHASNGPAHRLPQEPAVVVRSVLAGNRSAEWTSMPSTAHRGRLNAASAPCAPPFIDPGHGRDDADSCACAADFINSRLKTPFVGWSGVGIRGNERSRTGKVLAEAPSRKPIENPRSPLAGAHVRDSSRIPTEQVLIKRRLDFRSLPEAMYRRRRTGRPV